MSYMSYKSYSRHLSCRPRIAADAASAAHIPLQRYTTPCGTHYTVHLRTLLSKKNSPFIFLRMQKYKRQEKVFWKWEGLGERGNFFPQKKFFPCSLLLYKSTFVVIPITGWRHSEQLFELTRKMKSVFYAYGVANRFDWQIGILQQFGGCIVTLLQQILIRGYSALAFEKAQKWGCGHSWPSGKFL